MAKEIYKYACQQTVYKHGNDPWVDVYMDLGYTCEVDHNPSYPYAVSIYNVGLQYKVYGVNIGCKLNVWLGPIRMGKYSAGTTFLNVLNGKNGTSSWGFAGGAVLDIRDLIGNNFEAHKWVSVSAAIDYKWQGTIAGIQSSNGSMQFPITFHLYTPRICGGSQSNWRGSASRSTVYAYKTVTFTGTYSGFTKGNVDHTVIFKVNGNTIGSQVNQGSGTISGRLYIESVGNVNWSIECDGKVVSSGTWYFQEPPPAPPTMGGVSNTTWSSINTTQRKTLSANWWLDDRGWRIVQETYEWQCYSSHYGIIGSGTTTGTSASFNWDMPAKDVRDNIYWRVRAKNNTGWSGWVQSGSVEVYWAYIEPTKISPIRVSPNSFQLFDGSQNTVITFDAYSTINGWGDRPGSRNVEYAIYKNGSVLKWNGKLTTSSTGTFKQTLQYKVPETDLNSTYNIMAHKRLDNTEYTTSNDPRFPTTGANRCTAGNITFYEVIGKISGTLSLIPAIIISGIKSEIDYSWTYDKQSSEKVDLFIEVYRVTTNKVTDTFYLNRNEGTSGTYKQKTELTLVRPQEADEYEIRLKATVTELLGNTHTYTLEILTPEVYNPPVGSISLNSLSMPLPSTNATSTLAKQASDITWNYTYSYAGVIPTKVIMTISSKPYNTELIELEFSNKMSPYYNKYTRISKGDFTLGSTVTAYMRVYYQIIGYPEIYNIITNSISINITPTRYVYYLAQANIGEQQLNKIHQIVNKVDSTSKKIFITEK